MALMTVIDLEHDSQISRHTWRSWIRARKLPVVRLGRRVRVAEEDYRRFLAEHRDAQGAVRAPKLLSWTSSRT